MFVNRSNKEVPLNPKKLEPGFSIRERILLARDEAYLLDQLYQLLSNPERLGQINSDGVTRLSRGKTTKNVSLRELESLELKTPHMDIYRELLRQADEKDAQIGNDDETAEDTGHGVLVGRIEVEVISEPDTCAVFSDRLSRASLRERYGIDVSEMNYRERMVINAVIFETATTLFIQSVNGSENPMQVIQPDASAKIELALIRIFEEMRQPLVLGVPEKGNFKINENLLEELHARKQRFEAQSEIIELLVRVAELEKDYALHGGKKHQADIQALMREVYRIYTDDHLDNDKKLSGVFHKIRTAFAKEQDHYLNSTGARLLRKSAMHFSRKLDNSRFFTYPRMLQAIVTDDKYARLGLK